MTTFSVIIPVYNAESYLEQCLASLNRAILLANDLAHVEVICVDDGSNDDSGVILDRYAVEHSWLKVIHQKNAGVSIARNVGLRQAVGEWVSFVDSDDEVQEDYFLHFVRLPKKADVNFFAWSRFVPTGEFRVNGLMNARYITGREEIGRFVFELIFNRTGENLFGYTWNKFIRRALIEEGSIRFPELKNYLEYEDEIFTFKLCRNARAVSYSPRQLYCYRLGDNNSSRVRIPRHLERSRIETAIGDADDRYEFKSAAYMQAGTALLMRSYTTFSIHAAVDTVRYLKAHRQYLVSVAGMENRLAALSQKSELLLFSQLFLHGCVYVIRKKLKKWLKMNRLHCRESL